MRCGPKSSAEQMTWIDSAKAKTENRLRPIEADPGDNLQVANYDRIDHGGKGDAIDTLPGFLPPSSANPGWPRAVDNFLRLNYNLQREHMGPWTPFFEDFLSSDRGESASGLW
jgi:hypothetical protein